MLLQIVISKDPNNILLTYRRAKRELCASDSIMGGGLDFADFLVARILKRESQVFFRPSFSDVER